MRPAVTSPVFSCAASTVESATTFCTHSSRSGTPFQYVSLRLRMTWSPFRHSLNLNGPLATGGALFSAASSTVFEGSLSTVYLPKMCSGIGAAPKTFATAGQKIRVNFTVNFLGFAVSIVIPEMLVALPVE